MPSMIAEPGLIGSLALFAVVVVVTPGANNLLAATSGVRFGVRSSLRLISGLGLGVVVLVVVAAAGLGLLIVSAPGLQLGLRIAGTAYLLWLAWQIARAGSPDTSHNTQTIQSFHSGFLVSVLNPKVWLAGFSAVAGFSAISPSPIVLSIVFGLVFIAIVFPNLLLWCYAGQFLTTRLNSERQWTVFNVIMAVLLIASIVPMWLE